MLLASLVRLGPLNFCQTFLNSPFGLVGWIRLEVEDDHLALAVALAARIAELRGAQHFAQGDVLLFSVISLKGCLGGGALLDLKNLFFDAADFPCLFIGLDVGSTTVKAVVVDPVKDEILWQDYQRHETKQPEKVLEFLKRIEAEFLLTHENIRIFVTGSGGGCNLRDQ